MNNPTDPCVQAAVHAAHFERWQRLYGRGPILAPRGLEKLMPEPASAVRALLRGDSNGRNTRAVVRALARSRSPVARQFVSDEETLADYNGQFGKCRCDTAVNDYMQALGPDAPRKNKNVLQHRATLAFDPVTWVSTATEQVIFKSTREAALMLIYMSSPQNWAKSGTGTDDFFRVTTPTLRDAPREEQPEPPASGLWHLREETQWQLNQDIRGSANVVLEIEPQSLQLESEVQADPVDAARPSHARELAPAGKARNAGKAGKVGKVRNLTDWIYQTSPVVKLHFKYRLRECLETQFLVARSVGGIGVDEGETYIEWKADAGELWISASKSVRFEGTRELDADAATLLNMTAPATLSMLMQRLALDGPSEVIENSLAPRKVNPGGGGGGYGDGDGDSHYSTELLAVLEKIYAKSA